MNAKLSRSIALALLLPAMLVTTVMTLGCEEEMPTKMEIRPEGPIAFNDTGTFKKIHLAFFTASGKPYVRKPKAVFDAVDPAVVTVKADPNGATATLQAKKSGQTKVNITAFGLTGSIAVTSSIIGSVEFLPGLPKKMRVGGKKAKAKTLVKDDRGKILKGIKVALEASDYCISIDPDGTIEAVADGKCDIIARTGGKEARHSILVR